MQSTISRTPLVPEGGVPLEKGGKGLTFFPLYLLWVDSGDYRLVCWGCLVTVMAGQLSITPRSAGAEGERETRHTAEERAHLREPLKRWIVWTALLNWPWMPRNRCRDNKVCPRRRRQCRTVAVKWVLLLGGTWGAWLPFWIFLFYLQSV